MRQLILYSLFGLFTITLNASDNVRVVVQQTFSKAHVRVTEKKVVRLKDIDVANPLFIFR